ncbi:MAG: nicotinate (nicotinamide) nucleotide adenylyltransferase [Desulfosudaceae bacterium]
MKTGLYGGSFNPVHLGHVQIVRMVKKSFSLDKVIIVPSAQPPHKSSAEMAPADLRLEMTRLAFEDLPGCQVSDMELQRPGPSFTVDTVASLRAEQPAGAASLFLIMGVDAFLELDTWKNFLFLLETTPLIVVHRPPAGIRQQQTAMKRFLNHKISRKYTFSKPRACFFHPVLPPIFFFTRVKQPLSATEIRARRKAGQPVKKLLPDRVDRVIQKQGLYL